MRAFEVALAFPVIRAPHLGIEIKCDLVALSSRRIGLPLDGLQEGRTNEHFEHHL